MILEFLLLILYALVITAGTYTVGFVLMLLFIFIDYLTNNKVKT